METGEVLFGRDITKTVRLIPQRVIEEYWDHVQSVEQACVNLETNTQFTGSCFHLYKALSTTYFIDFSILRSVDRRRNKEDFIASVLGDGFSRVREKYYWVVNHVDTNLTRASVRIPVTMDKTIKKRDYTFVHEKSVQILEIVSEKYRQVVQWAEDYM